MVNPSSVQLGGATFSNIIYGSIASRYKTGLRLDTNR